MKAYNYTLAPVIADYLSPTYDIVKLQQAIESNGNDIEYMKIVGEPTTRANHRYTPERTGVRVGKPASSAATVTNTVRFEGKGNAPEQFTAWADQTVRMVKTFGALTAMPLPVVLQTWLDAKFKATPTGNGPARRDKGNVKSVPAPVVPA